MMRPENVSAEAEQLLTPREVGKKLCLTPQTITKMRLAGTLKGIKLGKNTVRFRASDINKYIRALA